MQGDRLLRRVYSTHSPVHSVEYYYPFLSARHLTRRAPRQVSAQLLYSSKRLRSRRRETWGYAAVI